MRILKRYILTLTILGMFAACGDDSRDEMQEVQTQQVIDSIPEISGDFIFLSEAAVLKGKDFIYGVQLDSTARDLVEKVESYKRDDFDMVPITVRAKIIPNPQRNGWDEVIQIREIIKLPKEQQDTLQENED